MLKISSLIEEMRLRRRFRREAEEWERMERRKDSQFKFRISFFVFLLEDVLYHLIFQGCRSLRVERVERLRERDPSGVSSRGS